MKRYRLVKDLPTFEVGGIFEISKNGNLIKRGECISDCIVAYAARTLKRFPNILTDWFEEIPEEPKTVWDLKEGDTYYIIVSNTNYLQAPEVESCCFRPALKSWVEMGELFLTREDAERAIARQKAEQVLKRDTKGFKPDWNTETQTKYIVYFDHAYRQLSVDYWNTYHSQPSLYFATEEDAIASIKAHPDEWKTYLGVEE